MFRAHCPAEDRPVLLTERHITDLVIAPDRVEIHFACWCGATGTVVDHRAAAHARPHAHAA